MSSSGQLCAREAGSYWRQFSKRPQKWLRDWIISPMRKGWERWDCSAWRRKDWGGISPVYVNTCRKGRVQTRWRQAFFSGAQWQDQRQSAQSETQEVPSEYDEALFHCDSYWELVHVAQWGCGVSLIWDIQKPSPGKLALGGPAWAGSLDQITSRGPFQNQTSCDSVNLACFRQKVKELVLKKFRWNNIPVQ